MEPLSFWARILGNSCGPCIGIVQAPSTGAVSLATFNATLKVVAANRTQRFTLVSPEQPSPRSLNGKVTDPALASFPASKARKVLIAVRDVHPARVPAQTPKSLWSKQKTPPNLYTSTGKHSQVKCCLKKATTSPPMISYPAVQK